jgi:hypothetical protein
MEPKTAVWVVGAICLKMIELAKRDLRNKNAPNVTPPITGGIKGDNLCRFRIFDRLVKEQSHFTCVTTKDYKLDPVVVNDRTVG